MIFDLRSGKRRRVVQVMFSLLAVIFAVSFIGFGIGSGNLSGGLFDALGIGGNSSGSGNPSYDQQIEDAQNKLEQNPNDQRAMLDLVNYHYLAATGGVDTDPQTGSVSISEDAHTQLEDTASAWEDYLKTNPDKPSRTGAATASQAYSYLQDWKGAAQAQRIVAESGGTASDFALLARYLYINGDMKAGDAAGDEAVGAADPTQRQQVRKSMDQLAEAARKYQKQLAKQVKQGGKEQTQQSLENPFGGLSPTSPTAPPGP
jgi:hypothetical protein